MSEAEDFDIEVIEDDGTVEILDWDVRREALGFAFTFLEGERKLSLELVFSTAEMFKNYMLDGTVPETKPTAAQLKAVK